GDVSDGRVRHAHRFGTLRQVRGAVQQQTHQPTSGGGGQALDEPLATEKIPPVHPHRGRHTRFERVVLRGDIDAVVALPGFHTQTPQRLVSRRYRAEWCAVFPERVPQQSPYVRTGAYLPTRFAGVGRALCQDRHGAEIATSGSVAVGHAVGEIPLCRAAQQRCGTLAADRDRTGSGREITEPDLATGWELPVQPDDVDVAVAAQL